MKDSYTYEAARRAMVRTTRDAREKEGLTVVAELVFVGIELAGLVLDLAEQAAAASAELLA